MRPFVNPFINKDIFKVNIAGLEYEIKKSQINDIKKEYKLIEIDDREGEDHAFIYLLQLFYKTVINDLKLNKNNIDINIDLLAYNTYRAFSSFAIDDNDVYPKYYYMSDCMYHVEEAPNINAYTTTIHYGIVHHTTNIIYLVTKCDEKDISHHNIISSFWHEFVHSLFYCSNEFKANDNEYLVDNLGRMLNIFYNSLS